MPRLNVNGKVRELEDSVSGETPLLWVLREHLNLPGTKFGCGGGFCGACTVHLDGAPVRSCQLTLAAVGTARITTVEGLAAADGSLNRLQQAWLDHDVPQCGYCQAGQLMSATALLQQHPQPTDEQIDTAMSGNLCRCGTYIRIRAAIHSAARAGRRS